MNSTQSIQPDLLLLDDHDEPSSHQHAIDPSHEEEERQHEAQAAIEMQAYEVQQMELRAREALARGAIAYARPIMDALYDGYTVESAIAASEEERITRGYHSTTLAYGEMGLDSFHKIFFTLHQFGFQENSGGIFVDLGSGSGRPLFSALLFHDFNRCIGVEILSSLWHLGDDVLSRWNKLKTTLSINKQSIDIDLYHGDATAIKKWMRADVIFAHWSCWDSETRAKIGDMANNCSPGTFFISVTYPLPPSSLYVLLDTFQCEASWGQATIYIQQRSEAPLAGVIVDERAHLVAIFAEAGIALDIDPSLHQSADS